MWQFSAVKYLLAPSNLEEQVPPSVAKKVFAYNIASATGNNVRVDPAEKGAHAVFELQNALPRYALLRDYRDEPEDATLMRLSNSVQSLLNGQLVKDGVEVVNYRPGRVDLKTQSDEDTMLRVAERWDAGWTATVDGHPVDVQRIDFLCQGVEVPIGEHSVSLSYKPSLMFVWMQLFGLVLVLVAMLFRTKRFSRC
jgi:hypothetical protein